MLFVTLPVLVWLIDGRRRGPSRRALFLRAASAGWWFGFGYFLLGLFWIGEAFLVEAEVFAWLMPFAVLLLPAGLALFTGLAAGVARLAWPPGIARVLVLAVDPRVDRMAARPRAHRLSLERAGLRADVAAAA